MGEDCFSIADLWPIAMGGWPKYFRDLPSCIAKLRQFFLSLCRVVYSSITTMSYRITRSTLTLTIITFALYCDAQITGRTELILCSLYHMYVCLELYR